MKRIKQFFIGKLHAWVLKNYAETMHTLCIAEIERVKKEEEKLTGGELVSIFKPFVRATEHPENEKYAIGNMSETTIEGIGRIANELETELSNAAMRQTGDEHYRRLWMAFGVHTLLEKIMAKQRAFNAMKLAENKKKDIERKVIVQDLRITSMKDIYDASPQARPALEAI